MARSARGTGWGVVLLVLLEACSSPLVWEPHPLPPPWDTVGAFDTAGPAPRPVDRGALDELRGLPVVDVHSHTFSARDLPMEGILLGKRDAHPLGLLLSDASARRIAAALATIAKQACSGASFDKALPDLNAELAAHLGETQATVEGDDCVQSLFQVCVWRDQALRETPALTGTDTTQATQAALEAELSLDSRARLRVVLIALGFALDRSEGVTPEGLDTLTHFVARLLSCSNDLESRYVSEHSDQIDLAVQHLMDLAPVYGQHEGLDDLLVPYVSQLDEQGRRQLRPESRQLLFAAYNPFRDHWPHGAPAGALALVKSALRDHGAYGIKLYPPSGYRPSGNVIPDPPGALLTPEPDRQWKARYTDGAGNLLTNAELDARLCDLFAFAEAHDLPIFAHCSTGEFQARKGYGVFMADPYWWEPVLEKYPNLRLCFGHAGGPDFWFATGEPYEEWGRRVFKLCVTYPNVYCEVGVHGQIADPSSRARFVARLAALIEDGRLLREQGLAPYAFEAKILYGSDWYMPDGVSPTMEYLDSWRMAFADPRLMPHAPAFFAANALEWLDVSERLTGGDFPPPGPVAKRLQRLLERVERRAEE